jgi:hypothetical protein
MRATSVILAPIIAMLGCAPLHSESRVEPGGKCHTHLDFTEATPWSIVTLDGRRRLRTVLPHLATPYLFGEYIQPFATTGGNRLYLFPTSEYAITSWCDICDEETLELGTWTFVDGVVTLTATQSSAESGFQDLGFFRRVIGDFRTLRFFVTAEHGSIGPSVLATPERLEAGPRDDVDGLMRQVPYTDWPGDLRRLRANLRRAN